MKLIFDLAERYTYLTGLEDDPKVVNTDGSPVNAYLELASECFEVPKSEVTVEMRDSMIKIVRKAVENSIYMEGFKAQYGHAPWNK